MDILPDVPQEQVQQRTMAQIGDDPMGGLRVVLCCVVVCVALFRASSSRVVFEVLCARVLGGSASDSLRVCAVPEGPIDCAILTNCVACHTLKCGVVLDAGDNATRADLQRMLVAQVISDQVKSSQIKSNLPLSLTYK